MNNVELGDLIARLPYMVKISRRKVNHGGKKGRRGRKGIL